MSINRTWIPALTFACTFFYLIRAASADTTPQTGQPVPGTAPPGVGPALPPNAVKPADTPQAKGEGNAAPKNPPPATPSTPNPAQAAKADPTYLTVDLASGGDAFVIDAGQYTLKFINRLPIAQYSPTTKLFDRSIPAPFDVPGAGKGTPPAPTPYSSPACDTRITSMTNSLNGMTCEAEVSQLRATYTSQLTSLRCTALDIKQFSDTFSGLTESTEPNPLPALSDGDRLVITVKRSNIITASTQLGTVCGRDKMTLTADGSGRHTIPERILGPWQIDVGKTQAQWLTFYGFNFASSGNQDYFSKTNTGTNPTTYTITRKTSTHGSAFSPSVYFIRIPGDDGFNDWAKIVGWRSGDLMGGLTAGVGFDFDKPTLFLGYGFGWGYNVMLTAGVVMHKEDRLNGQYAAGQVVAENLTSDQLIDSTYKPRAYVGLAFRFGSNPFSSSSSKPSTPSGGTDSKPKTPAS
jgi:hypothetical protein